MTNLSFATPAELTVAQLLCSDEMPSAPEIASQLGMAVATVRTHIRALANKIDNPRGLPATRLIRSAAGCSPNTPRREPTGPAKGRRGVSPVMRARVMERDGFRCRRCGNTPPDVKLAVDHVWPVAMGGETVETNLQTLCEDCNLGKGDRAPHPHDLRAPGRLPASQDVQLS